MSCKFGVLDIILFDLLHMIPKSTTRRCTSKDVGTRKGVDYEIPF